ncbi:pPIWI-associating nuclease domain-containing protein [Legionella fallonii]|uniref:Uncharacterized protein n=1 Tax=Legionella fallonii LLAP-10 TaxID=1212491 RepID=A0A098G629_9GAMM|nr:hypothetical protein [Legionella fallonii]CEG56960.1 protein of unknown function [Legionella fallonii LLAP-10]
MENDIINIINNHLLDGFEKDFFAEAIKNLENNSRLRLSNFLYAIRELIREVLARMSPDEKVLGSQWFIPYDKENPKKITRKQRMMYAIHGGIDPDYVEESLLIDAHDIIKDLIQKIDKLSKYTHITEEIFYENMTKSLNEIVQDELSIFSEFLAEIQNCKESVVQKLNDKLYDHVTSEFLSSTVIDIDHLSTHHFIEDISINDIIIKEINVDTISIEVEGSIYVQQQYGSSIDLENDNGAIIYSDFPYVCYICLEAFQPDEFKVLDSYYNVDTKEWEE